MDFLKTIAALAPSLATAIGGPVGGLAAKAICSALGIDTGSTQDQMALAINNATPEQLAALKRADNDFLVQMKQLDIDLERISSDDRDSARRREATVKDLMPKILASLVVAGFLVTVFLVLTGYVEGMKDPMMATTVGTLIGYVSSKADQIIGYYFGSSASSAAKTSLLVKK